MLTVRKSLLGLAALVMLYSAQAFAQFPTPFTADIAVKSKTGDSMDGKVFVGDHKMRMDFDAHGHQVSRINDPSSQTSYMLMHQQHMYMEMHAGQQNPMQRGPKMPDLKAYDPSHPCANEPDMECEKAGTETVNGRSCDKWIFKNKKTGEVTTAWVDQKLHFPIKTVNTDGSEMDLTNVKEGAPPSSTFDIPAGYRKFDMGAMMGGRPPQQ